MSKEAPEEKLQDFQQPYDNLLKSLFEGQERQILPYFLPDVEYIETLNVELIRTPLRVDRVYKVRYEGDIHILHLEFETRANNKMAKRLLEYHAYLHRKYDLPVMSIIVYPFKTQMAVSPLRETFGKEEVLIFHFRVFPVWQLETKKYISEHVVVLYALLPTMVGVDATLLNKAIDEMVEYYKGDDAKLAQELRWMGVVLRRAKLPRVVKNRIEERLNMWDDLMERDPKMRKIRKESEERGRAAGLTEGLQKAVITAVKLRFPPLTELAEEKIAQVNKPEKLNLLLDQITSVPDETTARMLLDLAAA